MWTFANLANGLGGLSLALFTRALGWTAEEVEVFAAGARNELKSKSMHGWWPM